MQILEKLNIEAQKLFKWYDKDEFEEFQMNIALFRMQLAEKTAEFEKKQINYDMWFTIFNINNKNNVELKTEKLRHNQYQINNEELYLAIEIEKAEIKMLKQKLTWYCEQREAIKTSRIDYLSENKQMR